MATTLTQSPQHYSTTVHSRLGSYKLAGIGRQVTHIVHTGSHLTAQVFSSHYEFLD